MAAGKPVYHLAFGQSPFPVVEAAQKALKEHVHQKEYEPVAGILQLREVICRYHKEVDGLQFSAENVLVGPGTKELIFLLLSIVCGEVFLLGPTWTTYQPQCLVARHNPVIIRTSFQTDWKLTPDVLDEVLSDSVYQNSNKLLILCNPDNPMLSSDDISYLCFLMKSMVNYISLVITSASLSSIQKVQY